MARGLDAAHGGHVEIHDDDIRCELADVRDGLAARPCLADDRKALLLEQVAQTRAEKIVVVDEQDAERLRLSTLGRLH